MSFWDNLFAKKPEQPYTNTRQQVKDRLRVIVESDKNLSNRLNDEAINLMKTEIMAVVRRYVSSVSTDDVSLTVHKEGDKETLEMNIDL